MVRLQELGFEILDIGRERITTAEGAMFEAADAGRVRFERIESHDVPKYQWDFVGPEPVRKPSPVRGGNR